MGGKRMSKSEQIVTDSAHDHEQLQNQDEGPDKARHLADLEIAGRLRSARRITRLTLGQLGEKCGLSAQGVHKYEMGVVRIPSGRLWQFAEALSIPITYFFDELAAVPPSTEGDREPNILDLTQLSDAQAKCVRYVSQMNDEDLEHVLYLLERYPR